MSKQIFTQLRLAFMLFCSLAAFNVQGQATTVTTDLPDYPPGATVCKPVTGSFSVNFFKLNSYNLKQYSL